MPGPEIQITPTDLLQYGQVTATTSATRIVPTAGFGVRSVMVVNLGASVAYLGDAGVTAATGFPLKVDTPVALDLNIKSTALYAIVASGTADIRWIAIT